MTTVIKFIVGILTALMLTSCNFDISFGQLRGNGNVIKEDMNISEPFTEVSAGNGWDVILEKGAANSVIIEADENLVDAAEVYVQNGKLKIRCEQGISSASSKKVFVTYAQSLEEISASSGASIFANEVIKGNDMEFNASSGGSIKAEVAANDVETDVSSGGVLKISGRTRRLDASGSSGGVSNLRNLKSKIAKADISSGGVIEINASEALKAEASSGGVINYYGNPKNIDKPEKNFSGGVIKSGN
ncbi:head GIN domain-containing protein [Dokdonia sp. Hel_I_53]|uniref:head GIN domain-containing protein n=1 Tax=Dokdonia sp. Hel_I_53 TaxID=1566287 RepID=UPI00119C2F07|nr:head GIN domain-containing protein [Dokdonia sp. Hel_I_53]TVZ53244.1 putative autotransporter adhesin-like protein [Dokdonia sp. Hel_I_53]